ncbi:MAG: SUF system NifU family Fe-S cluster assembly protein [Chloroflexaceae bacterium]|nr:SUF system NifU family Fe-S cluster assembly protein [Chloroflexaceae bacterium]
MDDFYREYILEHYKYPRNRGTLEHPTISHEETNFLCGDTVRLDILVENEVIQDIRFSGQGCAISMASASMLTEEIKGRSVEEAKAFSKEELLDLIGIPLDKNPMRLKCALLSLKTLKAGLYGVGAMQDEEL